MGRKGGHAGVINTFSRFTGVYPPPTCGQKRGSLTPLVHRGPVKPNDVLGKNKSVRVLAKVCGHLASASELNLGQSGARAGSSRGRVWPIPPFDRKKQGICPLMTIGYIPIGTTACRRGRVQCICAGELHPAEWVLYLSHQHCGNTNNAVIGLTSPTFGVAAGKPGVTICKKTFDEVHITQLRSVRRTPAQYPFGR